MTKWGFFHDLLKEARETWDYFITNETVYIVKYADGHCIQGVCPSNIDSYLSSKLWIEITTESFDSALGDYQVCIMLECHPTERCASIEPEASLWEYGIDDSVLINSGQFLKSPKECKIRPVKTIGWIGLKVGDGLLGLARHETGRTIENSFIGLFQDGKLNPSLGAFPLPSIRGEGNIRDQRQLPCDVVQGGTQVANDVSDHHTPDDGSARRWVHPVGNMRGIRLLVLDDGIFVLNTPTVGATSQTIDVRFRPFNLELSPVKFMHELYSYYEQGEANTEISQGTLDSGLFLG